MLRDKRTPEEKLIPWNILENQIFFFFLNFWPYLTACRILVPDQESNSCSLHWRAKS